MIELNDLIEQKLKQASPELAKLSIEIVRQAGRLPKTSLEDQVGEMIRRAVRERGDRRDS